MVGPVRDSGRSEAAHRRRVKTAGVAAAATDDHTFGPDGLHLGGHPSHVSSQEALASGGGMTSSSWISKPCRTGGNDAVVEGRFSVARRRLVRRARRAVLAWSAFLYNSSRMAEAIR